MITTQEPQLLSPPYPSIVKILFLLIFKFLKIKVLYDPVSKSLWNSWILFFVWNRSQCLESLQADLMFQRTCKLRTLRQFVLPFKNRAWSADVRAGLLKLSEIRRNQKKCFGSCSLFFMCREFILKIYEVLVSVFPLLAQLPGILKWLVAICVEGLPRLLLWLHCLQV